MVPYSRRSFIQLGSLAAAAPLVGRLVPVVSAVKAPPARTADSLVTAWMRVIPEAFPDTRLWDQATTFPLLWSQRHPSIYARTLLAVQDTLRELMEGVSTADGVADRPIPQSQLSWNAWVLFASWDLRGNSRDAVAAAEKDVFASLTSARFYNREAKSRLSQLAGDLGISVNTRVRFAVRLDHPHSLKWSSSRADLSYPSGASVIQSQMSSVLVSRVADYLRQKPELAVRSMQTAAALTSLRGPLGDANTRR